MPTIDILKEKYCIAGLNPGFAQGKRSILRYAIENSYIYCTSVNQGGPQPYDYLEYAKNNIITGGTLTITQLRKGALRLRLYCRQLQAGATKIWTSPMDR